MSQNTMEKFIFQISLAPPRAMVTKNGNMIPETHNYPVPPHSEMSTSKDGAIPFISAFLDLPMSHQFRELFPLTKVLSQDG